MFPVTLESFDGRLQTFQTPCYGFLRQYEWEDDSDSFCSGWHYKVKFPYHPASDAEPFGRNCMYHYGHADSSGERRIRMEELKAIWNSGSTLPCIGMSREGTTEIAYQYTNVGGVVYSKRDLVTPIDNVTKWSNSRGIEYTRQQFLIDLQNHVDVGKESALLFDERGFTGVRADIPADRALFYLMIDRELWDQNSYYKTRFIMEQIHDKGRNPMIAFLMSRIVSVIEGALGDEFYYSGSTNDSCILPDTLIVKGLGKKYEQPTSIAWFQETYSSGTGHVRDEDLDEEFETWYLTDGNESSSLSRYYSNSIFNSVFQLTQEIDSEPARLSGSDEPAIPLKVLFAKAVIPSEILNRRSHRIWDLGDFIENVDLENNLLVEKTEFEDLAFNLLMDIE